VRDRLPGKGQDDHLAVRGRLAHACGRRFWADLLEQRLQLAVLRVADAETNVVPPRRPLLAQRAAHVARPENAQFHSLSSRARCLMDGNPLGRSLGRPPRRKQESTGKWLSYLPVSSGAGSVAPLVSLS